MRKNAVKLRHIGTESLVDAVVLQLRDSIERSGLSSGDRLPSEPELVEQLGVSRTVLREAISRLQSIGLLVVKRGLGTYVADRDDLANCVKLFRTTMAISAKDLSQFIELREAIECQAARQAAVLASDEDLAGLESLCRQMEGKGRDYHEAMRLDLKFHLDVVASTGNKLMLNVLEVIQEFVLEGMLRTTPKPRERLVSQRYHMAIVDALRGRDPDAAEQAVREHMALLLRRLQESAGQAPDETASES
jgi:GntR family transcriptional repressor for pyruvate dehydrogenase complex